MLRIGLIFAGCLMVAGCFPTKEQAYEDYCLFHPHACKATDNIKAHAKDVYREVRTHLPEALSQ